jgi:hypothetical protein
MKVCYHCDHDVYPKGKVIFDDELAAQDKSGNWKCRDSMKHDVEDNIVRYAPNSPAARQIISERKRKEEFKIRHERMKKLPGERLAYYQDTGLKRYRP